MLTRYNSAVFILSPSTTTLTRARPTCGVSPPHTCDLNFQSVITKCLSVLFTTGDFHGPSTRPLQACGGTWEKPQTPDSTATNFQSKDRTGPFFWKGGQAGGQAICGQKNEMLWVRQLYPPGWQRQWEGTAFLPAEGFSVRGTTNRNFWSLNREILLNLPTAPSIDQKKAGCQHSHGAMGPAARVLSEHSAPPPWPFEPLTPGMLPSPSCSVLTLLH